jgi:uncharacterized protein (TIGR02996 family)
MSDEAAFLAAIIANPDDDTPRLVYADWLDENGDPDRAEFIRLQIDSARGLTDRRKIAVRDRLEELEKANRDEWLAPLRAACDGGVKAVFGRGFASTVSGGSQLLKAYPAIAALCPVQRLDIDFGWSRIGPERSTDLADSPALERLRWMECRRFPDHFGPVLASPRLTGLHTLYLQWGWLDGGVELVSRSPVAANLRHLWVWGASSGTVATTGGLGAVTTAAWPALTQLRFDNLAMQPAGVDALAREAAKRGWHSVHVCDHTVTSACATSALKEVLPSKVRCLSLGRAVDLREPPEPIADGVRALAFRGFDNGAAVARWVMTNVAPGRFNRLGFRGTQLDPAVVCELAEWPGLAQLDELDLRGTLLDDQGAAALAASPHLENVKLLLAAFNRITNKGKEALKKRFTRRVRIT